MDPRILEPLSDARIPSLHVSGRAPFAVELMVRRADAGAARRVLQGAGWRLAVGDSGLWRLTRGSAYLWADGLVLRMLSGVPAAPLPTRTLRGLERELWRDPQPQGAVLRPRAEPHILYLAVQAVREGLRNEPRLEELDACLGGLAERERLRDLARRLGLSGALDRALTRQAGTGLRDGSRGRLAESAARFMRRRARPRLLGDLMAGDLSGRAPVRCRFAGVEVRAAGGMFVPRLESEGLVRVARIRLEGTSPVAVEIGTGCGAAALALARALPAAGVHAVELDAPALRIARRNRRRLRLRNVRLYRGSLTDPLPRSLRGRVDVVFANLPCITDATWDSSLAAAADLAYRGSGPDGLDLHRRLASDARALLRAGGTLILQVSPDQWAILRSQLGTLGYARLEVAERHGPVVIGTAVLGEAASA